MKTFLTKIAMLAMFLLAITCGWAAIIMVFSQPLFNLLLGVVAAFFLLRGFELADKINKFGPYAEQGKEDTDKHADPDFKEGPGEE